MVRSLKDRVRQRFHLDMREVGTQDAWQRVTLGFAVVDAQKVRVEAVVAKIVRFVEDTGMAEMVGQERETLVYGEASMGAAPSEHDPDADWIPAAWREDDGGKA